MSTTEQKKFLTDWIDTLLEQTAWAEETAPGLMHQVTARRLHHLLIAAKVQVEELPDDGRTDTVWQTPTGVSLMQALGFEEGRDGRARA